MGCKAIVALMIQAPLEATPKQENGHELFFNPDRNCVATAGEKVVPAVADSRKAYGGDSESSCLMYFVG